MNKLTTKKITSLTTIQADIEASTSPADLETAVKNFVDIKTAFEAQLKATWKALEAHMIENDIKTISNLTVAEKRSWTATGTLPPRFYKQTLDTSRLNFAFEHGDKLPKGATFKTTKYLTKTSRKVEA